MDYVEVRLYVFIEITLPDCPIILPVSNDLVYSYFMATRGAVKLFNRGSGEDLGTVARDRRPRATVSKISTTEGQWFDCSPSSLQITVLLPTCFKSPKHCQQYDDDRQRRRDI